MSEHVGTRHHTVTVESTDLVASLLAPLKANDFPSAGQMNASLYLLFKAIKQEATVVLSGESADEVFGGYPWFQNEAALNAQTFSWLSAFLGRKDTAFAWLSTDITQEKGILGRASAQVLPEDVRDRKKSAYPTAPNPAYEAATRDSALEILNDSSDAIQPLINQQVARRMVENKLAGLPGVTLISLDEKIIPLNAWLTEYQVTLAL